jgi:RHS repeat-associated protein
VFQVFDGAGVVTSDAYDFKGNLLRGSRQLLVNYRDVADWGLDPALESEVFASDTTYDALGRPIILTTPDNSRIHPFYNEANLLERVEAHLRGADAVTTFVSDIDYNARGQRELIEYGNGVRTSNEYDSLTFRLIRLTTLRGAEPLQDLSYTYDPVGNITDIRDDAQQTIYFNNQVVEPHAEYTYDATYRLIVATGREHIGQISQPQTSWNDEFRVNLPHPNDGQAMRRYNERYEYDEVGNILRLIHQATNGDWTRAYAYNEPSLIEPAMTNNRLSQTDVGGSIEAYTHDEHGNMTRMSHLPLMRWNYLDQLGATSRQVVNNGGAPETTYYIYDAAGQRARKVTERQAVAGQTPTRRNERIYLGGFEIYREYEIDGATTSLERQTLRAMDGQQRIALVETRVQGDDGSPAQLIRYQLANHLGSALLELDEAGQVISYEEYYPFGSTSYQAVRSDVEIGLKRYRYTGKERDEETGLCYHGARYYAAWLGRWTAPDSTTRDGFNLYRYVHGRPTKLIDPSGNASASPAPDDLENWADPFLEDPNTRAPEDRVDETEPNRTRFRQLFEENDRNAAETLIESFRDEDIRDPSGPNATVEERLETVLRLTKSSGSPHKQFHEVVKGGEHYGEELDPTGDVGFRSEFRDIHQSSSNQIGHFLTAASLGYGAETGLLTEYVAARGIVGHEMKLKDDPEAGLVEQFTAPLDKDIQNFRQGNLTEIPIDSQYEGNSYQDLFLSYVGFEFGRKVGRGEFDTKGEAVEWLRLVLTNDRNLEVMSRSGSQFWAKEAKWMTNLLDQFKQTQEPGFQEKQRGILEQR